MATVTPRGKGTVTKPRGWRISPLLLVIPLIALGVTALIIMNVRSTSGPLPLATLPTQDFHALTWSPTDANTVLFGHHDGILMSRDGGATWQPTTLTGVDAMNLRFAPSEPHRVYAAGHGAFYRSEDGGATWQSVAGPLQTADIHGFAVSLDDAERLYAFVADQGLLTSNDGGISWQPIEGAPSRATALAAGPGQSIYVGDIQGTVYTSGDGGASWQQESIGMAGDVSSITYEPQSQRVIATAVMAGSNQGMLHQRAVGGGGWSMTALTGMGVPLALTVNPNDANTLLLVNNRGNVYRSSDGGTTWGGA
jgi:photosystem II stability/assembly factor-like uncharacterized protein